jgi:hypothetical protein
VPVGLGQDVARVAGPVDLDQPVGVVVQAAGERRDVPGVAGMALDQPPADVHRLAGQTRLTLDVAATAGGARVRQERVDPALQIPVPTLGTPHHGRFPLIRASLPDRHPGQDAKKFGGGPGSDRASGAEAPSRFTHAGPASSSSPASPDR